MPLYDYECFDSGHRFEHFCGIDDRPQYLACPRCGGRARQVFIKSPAVWGDELNDYQRKYVGNKHQPGCLQNNRAVAAGTEKPITTRKEFEEVLKKKEISLDRDIKLEFERD